MSVNFIIVRTEKARYEGMYCVPLFRWNCEHDETIKWWNQRVVPGRRETSGWKDVYVSVASASVMMGESVCQVSCTSFPGTESLPRVS